MSFDEEKLLLDSLKQQGLYREFRKIDSYDGVFFSCFGQRYLNFASNNYLNLSQNSHLITTLQASAEKWGVGLPSSRYVCGHHSSHEKFEKELALWLNAEAALFFNSAYTANLSGITALFSSQDIVVMDRSCHASLFDGVRLSRVPHKVFVHNDMDSLESCLKRYRHRGKNCWIVVESVYSMDGDKCPLKSVLALCNRYGSRIFLDESHALGVFGNRGQGWASELRCETEVDIRVSGLGKAVGVLGGVLCASKPITDLVRNRARALIYTTAMPIPIVECLREGIKLVALSHEKRKHLRSLFQLFDWQSPIVPFYVSGNHNVMALAQKFWDKGIFVPAMRSPTVRKNRERLRVSLNAEHRKEHIKTFQKFWSLWQSNT